MKKTKFLSIISTTILSTCAISPLASCSFKSTPTTTGEIKLSQQVTDAGVTLQGCNIAKDKKSTIILSLPSRKVIGSIQITIGSNTLTEADVSIDANKITIASNKMTSDSVNILSISLREGKALQSLTIKTPASKQTFYVGEKFDTLGLVLTASYTDGTSEDITTGFTTDFDNKTFTEDDVGTGKTVTVIYLDKTCTYTIDVYAIVLDRIEINTPASKISFKVGETFTSEDLTLKAIYTDRTEIVDTGFTCKLDETDLSGYKFVKNDIGHHTVTVTYKSHTTDYDIDVKAATLDEIGINTLPSKTKFNVGETFDSSGLKLNVVYTDRTEVVDTGYSCKLGTLDLSGHTFEYGDIGTSQEVTVTYLDKTCTYSIDVVNEISYTYTGYKEDGTETTVESEISYYGISPDSSYYIGNITFPSTYKSKPIKLIKGFENKNLITTITIPSSVEYILPGCFKGCSVLSGAIFEDSTTKWTLTKTDTKQVVVDVDIEETNAINLTDAYESYKWTKGETPAVKHTINWSCGTGGHFETTPSPLEVEYGTTWDELSSSIPAYIVEPNYAFSKWINADTEEEITGSTIINSDLNAKVTFVSATNKLIIQNSQRNIDADNPSYLFVTDNDGNEVNNFTVTCNPANALIINTTDGKISVNGKAGLVTISLSKGGYLDSDPFECSVATLNKISISTDGKVKAKDTSISGDVYIPDYYFDDYGNKVAVTGYEEGAFAGCTNITNVYDAFTTITSIPNNCFKGCKNLKSYCPPNSVQTIGDNCFNGCTKLETTLIPASLTETGIGTDAYKSCISLKDVYVHSNVIASEPIGYNTQVHNLRSGLYDQSFQTPINFYMANGVTVPWDNPLIQELYFFNGYGGFSKTDAGKEGYDKRYYRDNTCEVLSKDTTVWSGHVCYYKESTEWVVNGDMCYRLKIIVDSECIPNRIQLETTSGDIIKNTGVYLNGEEITSTFTNTICSFDNTNIKAGDVLTFNLVVNNHQIPPKFKAWKE